MSSFCWKTVKSVSGRLLPSVISLPRVTVRRVLWVSCIAKKICRSPGTFLFFVINDHSWTNILQNSFQKRISVRHFTFFLFQNSKIKYYCFVKFLQDWYGSGSYHESSRRSLAHDDWAFGTYFYFFNKNHSKSAKMLFRNRFSCKLCHSCRLFVCK